MSDIPSYWLILGNGAAVILSHWALAGRLVRLEADVIEAAVEKRAIRSDLTEASARANRRRKEDQESLDRQMRIVERMAQQIDAVEARVMHRLMTPEERQQRLEAWMAEADALHIDLSRIMKDLS